MRKCLDVASSDLLCVMHKTNFGGLLISSRQHMHDSLRNLLALNVPPPVTYQCSPHSSIATQIVEECFAGSPASGDRDE